MASKFTQIWKKFVLPFGQNVVEKAGEQVVADFMGDGKVDFKKIDPKLLAQIELKNLVAEKVGLKKEIQELKEHVKELEIENLQLRALCGLADLNFEIDPKDLVSKD